MKVKDLLFNGIPFAKKDSCKDLPTLEIMVCNLVLGTVTQQASVLKTVREENDILYFSFFEYVSIIIILDIDVFYLIFF